MSTVNGATGHMVALCNSSLGDMRRQDEGITVLGNPIYCMRRATEHKHASTHRWPFVFGAAIASIVFPGRDALIKVMNGEQDKERERRRTTRKPTGLSLLD